jgi:hypothetical protein
VRQKRLNSYELFSTFFFHRFPNSVAADFTLYPYSENGPNFWGDPNAPDIWGDPNDNTGWGWQ